MEDLVFERGADALTIRDVAGRAGCSTTIVSHYFRTKLEMLVFTHKGVRARAEALLNDAVENKSGLLTTMAALLPATRERQKDWNTWFAFWGMTPEDPRVTLEWHQDSSQAHSLFERLAIVGQKSGEVHPALDPGVAASMIKVIMNGISSLWAQDRTRWTAVEQQKLLKVMLKNAGLSQG